MNYSHFVDFLICACSHPNKTPAYLHNANKDIITKSGKVKNTIEDKQLKEEMKNNRENIHLTQHADDQHTVHHNERNQRDLRIANERQIYREEDRNTLQQPYTQITHKCSKTVVRETKS